MALTDALGNLRGFQLLPGQAHDLRGTAALIDGLTCGQFLADQTFDADWLREALADAGTDPVIPPKSNRRPRTSPPPTQLKSGSTATVDYDC